jgi:hypothetical protein
MNLFRRIFLRSDTRRARAYLQQVCDDRVIALRRLDETKRLADRALKEAMELEAEAFRVEFFGNRNLVRSAFLGD